MAVGVEHLPSEQAREQEWWNRRRSTNPDVGPGRSRRYDILSTSGKGGGLRGRGRRVWVQRVNLVVEGEGVCEKDFLHMVADVLGENPQLQPRFFLTRFNKLKEPCGVLEGMD